MKVLAAMSGGVDSAVAAARAVDEGHDVVGVHLALSRDPGTGPPGAPASRARGCCSLADAHDARRSADVLGIPFYVWDLSDRFAADVVDDFAGAYAVGRTPNPCVRCNERIKFSALLDRALALGFDALVTGHYARRTDEADGPGLHRAAEAGKDQSYVLAPVRRDRLARALFPLGRSPAKAGVRAEAAARGLAVAVKPDSHDICFVPDGDAAGWLSRRLGEAPGPVVDAAGREVGRHDGAHRFTVGQRRGLRLDRPAPDGRPRYVLAVRPAERTVVVGGAEELLVPDLTVESPSWLAEPPGPGRRVGLQVRAHGREIPATLTRVDGDRLVALP
ncbi:MAG: tRNA 2-thiouridine(34) synthase MnmA, partial [Kineosporiaceae bacterium]